MNINPRTFCNEWALLASVWLGVSGAAYAWAEMPPDVLPPANSAAPLLRDLKVQVLKRSETLAELDTQLARVRKLRARAHAKVRDFADTILPYDAFGSSEEGAQVALGKDIEPYDFASLSLTKRKLVDSLEERSTSLFLQAASAIAINDSPEVNRIWKELNTLVDPDCAARLITRIQQLAGARSSSRARAVTLLDSTDLMESATRIAFERDDVLKDLQLQLEKLSGHSKKKKAAFGSMESCLEVAAWISPGFFIPAAADFANATVIQLGGGSEEHKLLVEAYASKQLESRKTCLRNQIYKATIARQLGLTLGSQLLVLCADAAILDSENEGALVQTAEARMLDVPGI